MDDEWHAVQAHGFHRFRCHSRMASSEQNSATLTVLKTEETAPNRK